MSINPTSDRQKAALQACRLLVSELLPATDDGIQLAERIHGRLALICSGELESGWLKEPWMQVVLAFIAEKEFDRARDVCQQNQSTSVDEAAQGYLHGLIAYLTDDLSGAIGTLGEVAKGEAFHLPAWELYGCCLLQLEDWGQAREHYRKWHLQSDSALANFMQAVLTGEPKMLRRPMAAIREIGEATAGAYDAVASCQNYQAAQLMQRLLERILPNPAPASLDVLHAGCKTGLLASPLNRYGASVVGQEPSTRMRAIAEQRGVYDQLLPDDLPQVLENNQGSYDLIVALEVMENFGDLRSILAAVIDAVRPGGWVLFSVDEGSLAEEFQLQPTGSFVHSPHYLIWLLGQHGATGGTMHKVQFREYPFSKYSLMLAFQRPQ